MEVLQPCSGWHRRVRKEVSARTLAASLWQVAVTTDSGGGVRWQCGLTNELGFQFCSAPPSSKFSMEGVTKWDYINQYSRISFSSAGKKCINGAKSEEGVTRRLKRSIKKPDNVDEEVSSPMTTNNHDLINDVRIERNSCNCKKTHLLYAKLIHDFEKEKKAREFLEYACIQQAQEIEATRVEISELRNLCKGIRREAAEDRKMLQLAEAWREERAQMKLGDAKFILEDKFSQLTDLIAYVNNFLPSSSFNKNM